MIYKDFDLLIERAAQGYRAEVVTSPAGQATAEFTLPFSDIELENCLLRLGRPVRRVRRIESTEMQTAKNFGGALFDAVFSGDVRACFRSSVDVARREGAGVRIRLRLGDAALADLPWEYLYYAPVNRFLALSVHTPLVRYMELPERIHPIAVTPPIRVLVMISSPADYPTLDVEAEWTRLTAALGDLTASGHIAIDRLDAATLGALQRRLRKSQYHIFHFIGHGEFDQSLQEGVLLLEDEQHRGHRVGSQYLGMLLHDHGSLRIAILNACEGARSSLVDPFAGSAQCLVQQGIPAVIAMQFEIADDVASTFAHEFYGALADGYPIDAALTEARKAIFAGGHEVEWGTPVLYLRAPDGRIFDVERRAEPASSTAGRTRRAVHATEAVSFTAPEGPAAPAGQWAAARDEPDGNPRERAAALVRAASSALAHGKYLEAFEHLNAARELDPYAANLPELMISAEEQRAVADTRAHRRIAFQDHLSAATELFARADFGGALDRVGAALRLKPRDAAAISLRARIREALDSRGGDRPGAAPRPPAAPPPGGHSPAHPERGIAPDDLEES